MEGNEIRRVQEVFLAVLDLPASDRSEEVLRQCCGDRTLAHAVFEMIEEDARHNRLLDSDLSTLAIAALPSHNYLSIASQQVGRYRLLRLLGEGGMGIVYLAERTDIGGQVAVKILRDSWMSPMRRERFSLEQRLLAKLNHPNIARIFDAGALESGTPWFAMEYADGQSITSYVRERSMAAREVVLLFRQVCEAVQYAHRMAVIHRDLKPSNVLVTESGLVKLLDFGIAKVLDDNSEIDRTHEGLRLLTPAYAAPEQIEGRAIGTFTDVYALGVLLYEMLTGDRPESVHYIRPRMRARVRSAPVATKQEWADLEVLCATAAYPEPERRYSSVDALLCDIDAFLHDKPLRARPDTVWYVARKFAHRNRTTLSIVASAILVLVAITIGFTVRLARAKNVALMQAARNEQLEQLTEGLFDGGDPTTGPPVHLSASDLLTRGQLEADGLNRDPYLQADMLSTLGRAFEHLGQLDRADGLLQRALHERKSEFGPQAPQYANALLLVGQLRKDQGRIQESIQTLRQSVQIAKQVYAPKDPNLAPFLCALGSSLTLHGDYAESKILLTQAVQGAERAQRPNIESAHSLQELGEVEFYLARYEESASLTKQALHEYERLFGSTHPSVAHVLDTLGNISQNQGHIADAEKYFGRALDTETAWYGPNHPAVAAELISLAKVMASKKRIDGAERMLKRALAIRRDTYGNRHPLVALTLNEMGNVVNSKGNSLEAEQHFREALAIWRDAYGPNHPFVGLAYANLASVYLDRKEYRRAQEMCEKALQVYSASLPPDHPNLAALHVKLGRILLRQGKYSEAEPETALGYRFFAKHETGMSSYASASRKDLIEIEHHLDHPLPSGVSP